MLLLKFQLLKCTGFFLYFSEYQENEKTINGSVFARTSA